MEMPLNTSAPGIDANDTLTESFDPLDEIKPSTGIFKLVNVIIAWTIFIIGTFGIIGNILNLIVFAKMGFPETIHMSYAAMAVSDIGSIFTTMWTSFNSFTTVVKDLFARYGIKTDTTRLVSLTGVWPHFAFSRITALLTAWISIERCLCVMFPTKVRIMITAWVTKVVLASIYIFGACPVVTRYVGLKTDMSFSPRSNFTILRFYFNEENSISALNRLAFVLYGAVYPLASWFLVAICAAFLIVTLRQSVAWRSENVQAASGETASNGERKNTGTHREKRVTKTVVIIACIFAFCSLPVSVTILVSMFEREYSAKGSLRLIFRTNSFISMLFSEINSSINIIVYVVTGSKFRDALLGLFSTKRARD
ncbi:peptide receptor GPCR [Elysia marginata]|uniref:Peptide receptor GPCR n=1 Tax=Elysia marginata TaxID=1093978 RepID=A0AAV4GLY4_9GAST|nr:peptide receptor GPCR [Elysia marginata]